MAWENDGVKRAQLIETAEGLRAIADAFEHDFADPDIDDDVERTVAALILRSQAAALTALTA